MLKVFLVEDEVMIRKAIVKSIDWEKEGFLLAGNAGDGEVALPQILETRPDILVTDIRMPFMDGLELARLVKKELPHTRILIISGFNEFDYAKQAIDIGVSEYLLKPVTATKLLESLHKIGEKILEEQKSEERLRNISRRMREQDRENSEAAGASAEGHRVDLEEMQPEALDPKALIDFFLRGKPEDLDNFLDTYLSSFGKNNLKSLFFRQYLMSDVYFVCNSYLKKLGTPQEERNEILGSIEQAGTEFARDTEHGRAYLRRIFDRILEKRDQSRTSQLSAQMIAAGEFIRNHYSEDEMSLNQVAAEVHMSPSHFSMVFSKEMGEGFSEFLTDTRMEAAKRLIIGTDLRITEISEKVGYRNPHYFSSIFKKTQGVTPKDYRQEALGRRDGDQ